MIKIKQVNDRPMERLAIMAPGDTFLMDGCLCMLARRNGHDFVLNLSTGKDLSVNPKGNGAYVYPVTCELSYKYEEKSY